VVIQRQNLRGQIRAEILERLQAGRLSPGVGINEVQLAAELGVSRTPLREALIALENEGVIQSEQGKGFRFAPVSPEEFRELCPVLATLECLALRLSPAEHLKAIAPELATKAREFSVEVAEHGTITRHDDEWHDLLLSGCANGRLMELITTLKLAIHRYESFMVSDEALIGRAASEHAAIAERLLEGDVDGAAEALEANWVNGMNRVLATFEANGA
jgi:DNA-binding GntR family transcriptional regulator